MEKATNDTASDINTTQKEPSPSLHFYGPLDHVPACDNFPQVMHIKDYVALASGSVDRSNDPFIPTAQLGCIDWFFFGPIVFSVLMLVFFLNQTYSQQGGPLIAARRAWAAFRITICLDLVLIGRAYWRMHTRRSWVDRGPWNGVMVFEKGKVLTTKTKTREENGSIRIFNGGERIRVLVKQS
ncbi:hypothetical protein CKM354_001014000 [Cercospora kikuchii]|uniref:Uncharacterized protein n=1 Tax=Cercospora kikuchii TaxID=84275 RepID=A0A9P3FKF8_9PEZI|nr:uncharacterized protein CKM354_001014000 [Cercospora kikuchii]GIZ47039.1 hypothetical protein CKM354_001014000 [Cercospora kikuchii]